MSDKEANKGKINGSQYRNTKEKYEKVIIVEEVIEELDDPKINLEERELKNNSRTMKMINNNTQNIQIDKILKTKEKEEIRLNIEDSDESIIQVDDDQSEYRKSQTYIQGEDLGEISKETQLKIRNLTKMAKNKFQGSNEPRENQFTILPSLGKETYGFNIKDSRFIFNITAVINFFIPAVGAFIGSYFLTYTMSAILGLVLNVVVFVLTADDGVLWVDTNIPTDTYKRICTIPASANIIYEELKTGSEAHKYDLMLKREPYIIQENLDAHLKFKKVTFELPETFPFSELFANRVCYVKEYHGVSEDGICHIISQRVESPQETSSIDVEITSYEESFTIIPISGAESKVIFISKMNYGGSLANFFLNKISVERLNHLLCIKSYFDEKNQEKVYETFRTGTKIAQEISKQNGKDLNQVEIESEELVSYQYEEVKHLDQSDEKVPDEDSIEACADIDEASEVQSINDSYLDLTNTFQKSNPFANHTMINKTPNDTKRHTINGTRNYIHKNRSNQKKTAMLMTENVPEEVIYEEVGEDF
ncbi:unnamed protein product [Moneuplotes crassus]|uniref:Uncharacterized protein n=1 Tax=Euplotes crassus TaxID=5936 RepID=A0AAD1U446_EUPCR|nr:unnamed protein product [Moneuplotes crassus]